MIDNFFTNRSNQKGVVLVLVTFLLVISTVFALVLTTYFQSTALTSEVEAYKTQTLYLAEAGINQVVQKLRNNETVSNPYEGIVPYFQGQSGSYSGSFSVTRSVSGDETTLVSEAIVPINQPRQAKRILRVTFNSFTYQITLWEERDKGR